MLRRFASDYARYALCAALARTRERVARCAILITPHFRHCRHFHFFRLMLVSSSRFFFFRHFITPATSSLIRLRRHAIISTPPMASRRLRHFFDCRLYAFDAKFDARNARKSESARRRAQSAQTPRNTAMISLFD
jgi:hypothetical protein